MKVTIKETLKRVIDVKADNAADAIGIASDRYNTCEEVLDASDHVETQIYVENEEEQVTQPDFIYVRNLLNEYHPQERGFINAQERELVTKTLLLKSRDILSLRNLRNLVVAVTANRVEEASRYQTVDDYLEESDRRSAIVHVIDMLIFEKGGEV